MLMLDSPWNHRMPARAIFAAGRNIALYMIIGLYMSFTSVLEALARFTSGQSFRSSSPIQASITEPPQLALMMPTGTSRAFESRVAKK